MIDFILIYASIGCIIAALSACAVSAARPWVRYGGMSFLVDTVLWPITLIGLIGLLING